MPTRKTSVTLDADLLDEARRYGINVSDVVRQSLGAAVLAERRKRLEEELRPSIEAHNEWVRKNGLPLARVRAFMPED